MGACTISVSVQTWQSFRAGCAVGDFIWNYCSWTGKHILRFSHGYSHICCWYSASATDNYQIGVVSSRWHFLLYVRVNVDELSYAIINMCLYYWNSCFFLGLGLMDVSSLIWFRRKIKFWQKILLTVIQKHNNVME